MFVEGKILDIDGARALVKGGRNPKDFSVVIDHHVALKTHLEREKRKK